MKLLLDTHAFLWWQAESRRLQPTARRAISRADTVFVSAVTAWEVAIKSALGKLRVPGPVEVAVEENDFAKLPISFAHAGAVAALPAHHSDPFDRMLIAQAHVEGLTLVTHDPEFRPYGIPVVWT